MARSGLASLAFAALVACATPDVVAPAATVDTGTTWPSLVYTPNQDGVLAFLEDHCVDCHPLELLDEAISADEGDFVVPGDPDASVLWQVVVGGTPVEPNVMQMPFASDPLDDATIGHLKIWIERGAPWEPLAL